MLIDKALLLTRLEFADGPVAAKVRGWLTQESTQLVSTKIARNTVAEVRRLWKTRASNVDLTGLPLEGAEDLLARLAELAPQRRTEEYALKGGELVGNLFFVAQSHQFIGAVLVSARVKLPLAS